MPSAMRIKPSDIEWPAPSAELAMPSDVNKPAYAYAWLREKPITAVALVGLAGVLAGAFTLGLATSQTRIEIASAQAGTRAVETTGSAPPEVRNQDECRDETWPYLSHDCLVRPDGRQRNVRVVSTDRLAAPGAGTVNPPSGNAVVHAAAVKTAERVDSPAGHVKATAHAATQTKQGGARRRGLEQYTAGKFINTREYNVPSYDRSGRRKRVVVRRAVRYGSNDHFYRF